MSAPGKTLTIALICIAIIAVIFCVPITSMAKDGNNSTINNTTTATPIASVSPSPTPAAGPLFSNAYWNNDHVTVTVSNHRSNQVQVTAYIVDTSNNKKYIVDPEVTQTLDTPTVNAASGQILKFGFVAYENGVKLDSESLETTVTVIKGATPTPTPQETAALSGTILDSASQKPIAGAQVSFTSITYGKQYHVTTGEDGTFTTPKMYPDRYEIAIKADGYKTGFGSTPMVEGVKILDPITLDKNAVPSPTVTPSPSPTSPIDPWLALLYSPTVCVGTISSLIAVILGSIGIYDWLMKQRERRKKEEAGKGPNEKVGEKPAQGEKK